jgi:putative acetyltransferase
MQIRRFLEGDAPALYQVYFSAVHGIASRDYTPEQVHAWAPVACDVEPWAARMRAIQPFVVERQGRILGYADIEPSGFINHFFVSGQHPRQGVGRLLMERIHQQAYLLGLAELTAHVSATAEPFFAHFGFQVLARHKPVRRGVELHNASMRKLLPLNAIE